MNLQFKVEIINKFVFVSNGNGFCNEFFEKKIKPFFRYYNCENVYV